MKGVHIDQRKADRIISILLLVIYGFILLEIRKFSEYGRYFPFIITSFLLIFTFFYFVKSWITPLVKREDSEEGQQELIYDLSTFLISLIGVLVYIFILLTSLGFLVGSTLFCIGVVIAINVSRSEINLRSLIISFFVSSLFTYLMYYIFRHLFNIRLP